MSGIFRFKKLRLYVAYPFAAVYFFLAYYTGIDFSIGIWSVFLGLIIRFWAAGFIRKKRELAVAGPYALVRNPLYLGNFLVGFGFSCFVNNIFIILAYCVLFAIFYIGTIREEEILLTELFGQQYLDYKKSVPSIFPLFKTYKTDQKPEYSLQQANRNGEFIRVAVTAVLLSILYCFQGFILQGSVNLVDILIFAGLFIMLIFTIISRRRFLKRDIN
ncbi:MAG: isoprenylcysteine carboxylmethyltransferase family protein [PVC group bacterium]|nr:isoprenylcysteine carboxylmethyltransferase family protein [PVC group bacterium]